MLELCFGPDDDGDEVTAENVSEGPRFPTNFGVVTGTRRNGASDGVYIIYSFYPIGENTGNRPSKKADIPDWGRLGDLPGRMTVAKIANTTSKLVYGRRLEPAVIADYPAELARAVLGWKNTIQRVTVMGDERVLQHGLWRRFFFSCFLS